MNYDVNGSHDNIPFDDSALTGRPAPVQVNLAEEKMHLGERIGRIVGGGIFAALVGSAAILSIVAIWWAILWLASHMPR